MTETIHNKIIGISNHIYINLDKIFNINITLLAFIITAVTILLAINTKEVRIFKELDLYKDVISLFHKALNLNLISAVWSIFFYLFDIKNNNFKIVVVAIAIVLFFLSLYYVYLSYRMLIFLIKEN